MVTASYGAACARVKRARTYDLVNPILALGLLAVAGLLAARLPRPSSPRPPSLDLAVTAGAPLVLLGLVLGPGIELLARPLWRALAPLTAFAVGWIGAALGARFEWRYVRRIPRATGLLAAAGAGAAFLVVALGAWLLAWRVPSLAAVWAPRLPTVLGLAAVAAASGPGAVTAVARAVGVAPRLARALSRAAALETAAAALAMGVPLAPRHPVAWTVVALSGGAPVGWGCASVRCRACAAGAPHRRALGQHALCTAGAPAARPDAALWARDGGPGGNGARARGELLHHLRLWTRESGRRSERDGRGRRGADDDGARGRAGAIGSAAADAARGARGAGAVDTRPRAPRAYGQCAGGLTEHDSVLGGGSEGDLTGDPGAGGDRHRPVVRHRC